MVVEILPLRRAQAQNDERKKGAEPLIFRLKNLVKKYPLISNCNHGIVQQCLLNFIKF